MKALLALNESTTAEILADLLQIPPEQAQQIAGQLRLSEILNLVQELKANNMLEANEILKPYLAELQSGSGGTKTAAINQSNSTMKSTRPTVKGQNANQADMDAGKEQPDEFTTTITGPAGQVIDQSVDSASTAMRKKRAGTVANRGQAIRNIAGTA